MLERHVVSVSSPARSQLIVPVATVRSELGIADTSQDTKIARLILSVAAAFAGQGGLQRPLVRQTYVERAIGLERGGDLLLLSRRPIESVTSVTEGVEAPETIAAADYSVSGAGRAALYREDGWPLVSSIGRGSAVDGGALYDYTVTYIAGWLPPGSGAGLVASWAADTATVAGTFVKATASAYATPDLLFEATTVAGDTKTHATTEPTWPTTAGLTVVDDQVTWTARAALELPFDIQEAAIQTAKVWFRGALELVPGYSSINAGEFSVVFDTVSVRSGLPALPPFARSVLQGYR